MKRKLTAVVLALTLLLALTVPALGAEFTDVDDEAVTWAVAQGITNGTSATTFSPASTCTRAQMVTFLWRAAGCPAPTSTDCPFTDVESGAYYAEAVLWAVEQGITNGTSATTFSPDALCTEGQAVTFLYRSAGLSATAGTSYYADAAAWAEEAGLSVSPEAACTRLQMVTYLYRLSGAVIVFSDTGIEASGSGFTIDGTALKITESGTYLLSGDCADGSITVKKGVTGVTLVLNGLTLTSADTAPITCNKSSGVTILAAAGTVNTLSDTALNNDETHPENENAENAVIKAKDGAVLTLCGTGTLNILSNGKNGIKGGATTEEEGESRLTVAALTLNITANAGDGLKSDQELNLLSGTITVSAADDGIKSDLVLNIGVEGTAGPTILVAESTEGIEAATLHVYAGLITVNATDDGVNAANSDLTGYAFGLNVYGGILTVNAQGDGLDSNGSLTLAGGTVTVYASAQNDNAPLDCDGLFTLTGGTVLALGSGGMAQNPSGNGQVYVSFGAGMGGFGGPGQRGGFGMPGGFGQQSGVSIQAGDVVEIADATGTVLASATAVRGASYVFFSDDALVSGGRYVLLVNGSQVGEATAQ